MSKKRAFVRYSKQGKIVPGSLILTSGSYPNGPSTWKEVPADLCCGDDKCVTPLSDVTVVSNEEIVLQSGSILITTLYAGGCFEINNVLPILTNFEDYDSLVTFLNTNLFYYGVFSYVAPNKISLQIASFYMNLHTSSCPEAELGINIIIQN